MEPCPGSCASPKPATIPSGTNTVVTLRPARTLLSTPAQTTSRTPPGTATLRLMTSKPLRSPSWNGTVADEGFFLLERMMKSSRSPYRSSFLTLPPLDFCRRREILRRLIDWISLLFIWRNHGINSLYRRLVNTCTISNLKSFLLD